MLSKKIIFRAYSLILLTGAISVFFDFLKPSNSRAAIFAGYSRDRLILISLHLLIWVFLFIGLFYLKRWVKNQSTVETLKKFISNPTHYVYLHHIVLGIAIFLSWAFFFELIFVPFVLAPIAGWLAISSWLLFWLCRRAHDSIADVPAQLSISSPKQTELTIVQKRIALVLLLLGLIYFICYIPVNSRGAETPHNFFVSGGDEYVMYPVVIKMLASQASVRFSFYRFFIYGDYVYGFPFYGLSALLLIPSKLIFGTGFAEKTQINLLLLRQLISVLPMVLSAFLFTYLATRFRKWWVSLSLFAIILTLPGVIKYDQRFWHPDSLNLLFIALTFFFLDRDRMQFSKNFYIAGIMCGLSVATRLFGLFFFLAIAGYLFAGVRRKKITLKAACLKGALFIVLMVGTLFISNPYLFSPGEQASLFRLSGKKQSDLFYGYNEPDPEGVYRTGILAWVPFITRSFGNGLTLGFICVSVLCGMFLGNEVRYYRILTAWLLVVGTFLIGFVVVKSFQYMLPFLIPAYSGLFWLPLSIDQWKPKKFVLPVKVAAYVIPIGIAGYQLFQNIQNIAMTRW